MNGEASVQVNNAMSYNMYALRVDIRYNGLFENEDAKITYSKHFSNLVSSGIKATEILGRLEAWGNKAI